ncbi:hypothetical protein [Alteromonas macleodii]|nr:hypothetical protein [Alteromonas macleodii]
MALKQLTTRLTPDAVRILNMHLAANPSIKSQSDAINDILMRFEKLSQQAADSKAHSLEEVMAALSEQSNVLGQLFNLGLRSYGLNVEVAAHTEPNLPSKGEARAKQLLAQVNR